MGVTVVIPCRNMGKTLQRAVESAFRVGANEVIVFDDASEDDSWNVANTILKDNPNYQTLCSTHRVGVSVARNMMIEDASHQWIIPLDADDELLHIPMLPGADQWCYGGWIEVAPNGSETAYDPNYAPFLKNKPLCHATSLFSKAQWRKVGGYNPDFAWAEDYAFQCALVQAGVQPIRLLDKLYRRYLTDNNRTEQARKHWTFYHVLAKEYYPSVFL